MPQASLKRPLDAGGQYPLRASGGVNHPYLLHLLLQSLFQHRGEMD
jgi:hypothetical protein